MSPLLVLLAVLLLAGAVWYVSASSSSQGSRHERSDSQSTDTSEWRRDPSRNVRRKGADYWLEWGESEDGQSRGYNVVRAEDGARYMWKSLKRRVMLQGVNVAGEPYHMEDLQHEDFAPGSYLSLVPEPENPHGETPVAVKSADETLHAGYIPEERSERIFNELQDGVDLRCISLWEVRRGGDRVSLRILIARPDTDVALP